MRSARMNKIWILISLGLLLKVCVAQTFAQLGFEAHVVDNAFSGVAGISTSDIDGDGDIDILGGASVDGVAWWRNDGGNPVVWTKRIIDNQFQSCLSVITADVDGDMDVDVCAASFNGNTVALWLNGGGESITWQKQIVDSTFSQAHEVYACDFDMDGDVDLFGAAAEDDEIAWWRNDGGNPIQWVKHTIDASFNGARSMSVADFDQDGDNDVVGAALLSNEVTWWRNEGGDPIMWTEIILSNHFLGSHRVQTFDMDYDGDADILAAAYGDQEIAWWRNEGGDPVQWTKIVVDSDFRSAVIAVAGDMDNDGDTDVVGTGQDASTVAWWRNDGNVPINWEEYPIDAAFGGAWPLTVDDMDGDGDLDIIAGGYSAGVIKLWENSFYGIQFDVDVSTGHAPLTVAFTNNSHADPPFTSWRWDFDGDGVIDANVQNPTWTYPEPGVYSVSLEASNEVDTVRKVTEQLISVFNGASALLFDGEKSDVFCTASETLNISERFTAEAWLYPHGWGENSSLGFGRIFDKEKMSIFLVKSHAAFNDHSIAVQIVNADNQISFSYAPENAIILERWQHVAVSYESASGEVKIYIDGISQTVNHTVQPSGLIMDNTSIDLHFGNSANNIFTSDGIIDEVRLWNVVRSGSQVLNAKDSYLSGDEHGLIGYWPMDEGNGAVLNDYSLNGNNGAALETRWMQGVSLLTSAVEDAMARKEIPRQYALYDNYPNPFSAGGEGVFGKNTATAISYELPKHSNISLKIYTITGSEVRTLVQNEESAGLHEVFWNGDNEKGVRVSSGVYLYRLSTEGYHCTKKILVIK